MDKQKRAHMLLGFVVLSVLIAIFITYWRSIIQKDFYIILPEENGEIGQVE